jgi:hypothetical protein
VPQQAIVKLLGASRVDLEGMIKVMSTVMLSRGNEVRPLQMLLLGTKGDVMDALAMTTVLEIMETPRHGLKAGMEITTIVLVAVIMGVVQEPHLGHAVDKLATGTADTLRTPLPRTWLLALVSHRIHPPCTMALAVLPPHLPYVHSFNIGDSCANKT